MNLLRLCSRQSWARRWLIGSQESWVGVSWDGAPASHQAIAHTHTQTHTHTYMGSLVYPPPLPPFLSHLTREAEEEKIKQHLSSAGLLAVSGAALCISVKRFAVRDVFTVGGLTGFDSLCCCSNAYALLLKQQQGAWLDLCSFIQLSSPLLI